MLLWLFLKESHAEWVSALHCIIENALTCVASLHPDRQLCRLIAVRQIHKVEDICGGLQPFLTSLQGPLRLRLRQFVEQTLDKRMSGLGADTRRLRDSRLSRRRCIPLSDGLVTFCITLDGTIGMPFCGTVPATLGIAIQVALSPVITIVPRITV